MSEQERYELGVVPHDIYFTAESVSKEALELAIENKEEPEIV